MENKDIVEVKLNNKVIQLNEKQQEIIIEIIKQFTKKS